MKRKLVALLLLAGFAAHSDSLENGKSYTFKDLPKELVAHAAASETIQFSVEENITTGFRWEAAYNRSDCELKLDHCASAGGLVGAPGKMAVELKSLTLAPVNIEFQYRRPWETNTAPARVFKLIVRPADEKRNDVCPPKETAD